MGTILSFKDYREGKVLVILLPNHCYSNNEDNLEAMKSSLESFKQTEAFKLILGKSIEVNSKNNLYRNTYRHLISQGKNIRYWLTELLNTPIEDVRTHPVRSLAVYNLVISLIDQQSSWPLPKK